MPDLSLLERRRLEAAVLIPVIRAMQAEFGEEKVNQLKVHLQKKIQRSCAFLRVLCALLRVNVVPGLVWEVWGRLASAALTPAPPLPTSRARGS